MQFWVLEDVGLGPDAGRWWSLILSKRAEARSNQFWWDVFDGKLPPPGEPAPFRICDVLPKHEQGDVMGSVPGKLLFSARLSDLLVSVGCKGFSPNPSIIYDVRDRKVECTDATWTQFQRGCGQPDDNRGYDPARPTRGNVGLVFDHSTWTGLDIFKPIKSGEIVLTNRIAKAIQAADLRGYHLVRTEDYGKDLVDAINIATGHRPGTAPPPPPAPISPAELEAAAPSFRLVSRADPRARPMYDMAANAIAWPDEFPLLPPGPLSLGVRLLWRSRTCLLIGAPIEHEALWNKAKELFPQWIGFLPARTTPTPELVELYRRGEAARRGEGVIRAKPPEK